jgi:hypothetical protein
MPASTTNVLAGERTMLKAITQVGAIAGLLTTAFVIWDRWVRGRPLAWVTAEKSVKSGANSISPAAA